MKPATEIESNGKIFYFSFGMAALSRFCEAENLSINELGQLAEGMTPLRALRLIHAGLKDGYRREGKPFELDIDDIGDIVDSDPDFIGTCMDIVTQSMPNAGNVQAAQSKRKTSR